MENGLKPGDEFFHEKEKGMVWFFANYNDDAKIQKKRNDLTKRGGKTDNDVYVVVKGLSDEQIDIECPMGLWCTP